MRDPRDEAVLNGFLEDDPNLGMPPSRGMPPPRSSEGQGRPNGRPADRPMDRQQSPPPRNDNAQMLNPPHPQQSRALNFKREQGNATAIGAILVLAGIVQWIVNAEYTGQGIGSLFNLIFDWFNIPVVIPRLEYFLSIPIGVFAGWFITQAQIREFPFEKKGNIVKWLGVGAVVGWLMISAFDVITTAWGYIAVPDDAWDIHRAAASNPFIVGVWSVYLSFAPEALIIAGWKLIGWPVPSMFKRK